MILLFHRKRVVSKLCHVSTTEVEYGGFVQPEKPRGSDLSCGSTLANAVRRLMTSAGSGDFEASDSARTRQMDTRIATAATPTISAG
ncbi:hypothetical protein SH501x_001546 [Pirellulaceae bacterium SH501]